MRYFIISFTWTDCSDSVRQVSGNGAISLQCKTMPAHTAVKEAIIDDKFSYYGAKFEICINTIYEFKNKKDFKDWNYTGLE